MHQARLARAGRAQQGDDLRRTAVDRRLEGVLQLVERLVAADEARHLPGDERRGEGRLVGPLAGGQIDGFVGAAGGGDDAFRRGGKLELRPRLALDGGRGQHLPVRRSVLQPAGDGDRLAHGRQPGAAGGAGEVDRPAVDADAHGRAGPVGGPGHPLALRERALHSLAPRERALHSLAPREGVGERALHSLAPRERVGERALPPLARRPTHALIEQDQLGLQRQGGAQGAGGVARLRLR